MYILGLNNGDHDGAAALLKNGQLICLVEQERITRQKKAFGDNFSLEAIAACLEFEKIGLDDIEAIALGWETKPLFKDKFYDTILASSRFSFTHLPPLYSVRHHVAHAASAFWTSGFERAAILVIDGRGETQATTLAVGNSDGIRILGEWDVGESLGAFYGVCAKWVGFSFWDTGKLMGLASYGVPNQRMPLIPTADGYTFLNHKKRSKAIPNDKMMLWTELDATRHMRFLEKHFRQENYPFTEGDKSEVMAYANFASSAQYALEEAVMQLARVARERTGENKLVLAGGVAMNCTLNGRLARSHLFDDMYIPPVPFDVGVSLGAALMHYYNIHQSPPPLARMEHAYWAPSFSPDAIAQAISQVGLQARKLDEHELINCIVTHLTKGRTIGWFSGRAEIGQRALGARSILCDPRQRRQLAHLNTLKGREIWRPLAPSVQEEYKADIFGSGLQSFSNFMLAAWPVRAEVQTKLPVNVHVDGSARPQVVSQKTNPRFWKLINAFREETGVPALVNTSFNLAGEPIVYAPSDAISTFCRSDLDVLVLDDFIVEKSHIAD